MIEWLLSKQMETPGEMCRWMGGNSLTFNLCIDSSPNAARAETPE